MKRMMMMIAALAALCLSVNVFAQDQQNAAPRGGNDQSAGWMEKMKAARVAFLTNELSLTSEEAQAFWPIYNQAQAEKDAAFRNTRTAYREMTEAIREGKSDKEVAALLNKYLKAAKVPAELDAEYAPEYLKVLSATKVAKLYVSEEKFRKMQFQNLQGPGRGQGAPGMRDGNRGQWQRDGQGGNPGMQGRFPRNGQSPRGNRGGQAEGNTATEGGTL